MRSFLFLWLMSLLVAPRVGAQAPVFAGDLRTGDEVLTQLREMATTHDTARAYHLVPEDLTVAYASAWWFNRHAGELGIAYSPAEVRAFGLEELNAPGYIVAGKSRKALLAALEGRERTGASLPAELAELDPDRLDQLPGERLPDGRPNPDFATIRRHHVRDALAGGLYRLMKGIPRDLWPRISVTEVKRQIGDPRITDVFLACEGTPILQVALYEKSPGARLGISYLYFRVGLKKLSLLAEAHPAAGAP